MSELPGFAIKQRQIGTDEPIQELLTGRAEIAESRRSEVEISHDVRVRRGLDEQLDGVAGCCHEPEVSVHRMQATEHAPGRVVDGSFRLEAGASLRETEIDDRLDGREGDVPVRWDRAGHAEPDGSPWPPPPRTRLERGEGVVAGGLEGHRFTWCLPGLDRQLGTFGVDPGVEDLASKTVDAREDLVRLVVHDLLLLGDG